MATRGAWCLADSVALWRPVERGVWLTVWRCGDPWCVVERIVAHGVAIAINEAAAGLVRHGVGEDGGVKIAFH